MDAKLRAEIDHYAEQVAAATPDPSPGLAAALRPMFNPPSLAQDLAHLDADAGYLAERDERQRLRNTREYRAERERLRANVGHHAELPPPPRRNQRSYDTKKF